MTDALNAKTRELKGWHVFAMVAGSFAVIIAVNVTLAVQAVRTFPGLEVANSYVASQDFDASRRAQEALGWQVAAAYTPGTLRLNFTGADGALVWPQNLVARLGRPTEAADDQTLTLTPGAEGFTAPAALAPGKWVLFLTATAADGTPFQQRLDFFVRSGG